MDKDILKGIKFSFGIILGFSILFGIVYAVGFHTANEIIGGTFLGNYIFTNNVSFNGNTNFTNSNVSGLNISSIPFGAQINFNLSSCPNSYFSLGKELIQLNPSLGTIIGTMTNKNLGFDNNTAQAYSSSVYGTAGTYIGKDWGVGNNYTINKYVVYSASNYGFGNFGNGGNQTQIIQLRGSNDGSTWTVLHSDIFQETSAINVMKTYNTNINTSNAYRYHSVSFSSANSNSKVSEIIFYKSTGIILCEKQ